MNNTLEQVQERIDEIMAELDVKNDILRGDIEVDADRYQEVDFEATHLDGELKGLIWVRGLLQK